MCCQWSCVTQAINTDALCTCEPNFLHELSDLGQAVAYYLNARGSTNSTMSYEPCMTTFLNTCQPSSNVRPRWSFCLNPSRPIHSSARMSRPSTSNCSVSIA